MNSLLVPAIASLLLFGLFSIARESLVPRNADFDRARWRLTGDEPAYLLTAQAIASGDGEDVSRVHASGTYSNFQHRIVIGRAQWTWSNYKRLKCPHWIDRSESWGETRQVIQRPPLIAAFAAPFALSQSHPRWSILLALGAFASLSAFLLLSLTARRDRSAIPPAFACIAVFGSMPVLQYTAAIYPEILMGCLLALSMALWRHGNPILHALAVLPLVASLWGSGRVVPAIGLASIAMAWQEIRARRFVAPALLVAGWCGYIAYNLWLWGYPVPPTPENGGTLDLSRIPVGLAENFIGNDVGLFLLCPVSIVGAACCIVALVRHRGDPAVVPATLLAAGVALVVASFSNPRAGTCPAGRYQVVQAVILLVPILICLGENPGGSVFRWSLPASLFALGAISLAMGITIAFHPSWSFERFHPFFKIKRLQPYYRFLPDFRGLILPRQSTTPSGA